MPFDALDGKTPAPAGPVLAPARPSAQQARKKPVRPAAEQTLCRMLEEQAILCVAFAETHGLPMSDTCGPSFSASSASVALTISLESRLRALTASYGSTLYQLRWKSWATPLGRSIPALRASGRPKSDKDSIGPALSPWVTPTTRDWKDGANPNANVPLNGLLGRVAWLAGWPSPTTPSGGQTFPPGTTATGKTPDGRKIQVTLGLVADLTHWPDDLAGPARLTASGSLRTGCDAEMKSGGRLSPAHSRWLQGLPLLWDLCAPTGTRSTRNRRLRSPMRISEAALRKTSGECEPKTYLEDAVENLTNAIRGKL